MALRKNRLGKTDIEVTEVGLGGLFVSKYGGEFEQARATIDRALDLGINYIDTAPSYLDSEEVLGKALGARSSSVVISTKLFGRPQPFDPRDPAALRGSVETSLELLHRDTIDILFIHEPDRPRMVNWWTDWERLEGPVLGVLDDFKREGTVRYTGIAGTTAHEMPRLIRTGMFDVLLTAFNYSPLWREAAIEVLPAAVEMGMGAVAGSALQQGALAARHDEIRRERPHWMSLPRHRQYIALYDLLDDIGMSLPHLATRFVLSHPAVDTVLAGAKAPWEIEETVAAAEQGPLPADVAERLDEIAAMVPFRPHEEPFVLPFGRKDAGPGSPA